jgi:CRISPR-associated protein Cas2
VVYVVVVYDVQADRTHRFLNFLRQYLTHVQNSVFEGEITEGDIEAINHRLESMLEANESVILYRMTSEKYVDRTVYGEDPAEDDQFL